MPPLDREARISVASGAGRRAGLIAAGGVALVLVGLLSHGHFGGSGDAVHYMMVARSLAFDRDFDLANDYADPKNLILNGELRPENHARPGVDGRLRPVHDVGWPLASAPVFAAAYAVAERVEVLPESVRRKTRLDRWNALRQLLGIALALLSAAMAFVLVGFLRALDYSPRAAALGAAFVSLTPPLLTMGYVYMTEVPTALLALAIVVLARGERTGPWLAALLGFAAAYLVVIHARNVGLALALALFAFPRGAGARSKATFVAGVALAAALRCAINQAFWGTWVTSPHARLGAFEGWGPLGQEAGTRLLGLLFDQRHGLLPQAPAALLVPAGLLVLRRRDPRLAGWLLAFAAAYLVPVLLPVTNTHGWRGGFSPAARFLVPLAPFAGLCILEAARASRAALAAAAPLIGLQVLIAAGFWSRPMLSWAEGPGPAPWIEAWSLGPLTHVLPAWDPANLAAVPTSVGLLLASAGFAFLVLRSTR